MSDTMYKTGDSVVTPQAQATVIDARATPSGKWVFGVEMADGTVTYFTSKALHLAQG